MIVLDSRLLLMIIALIILVNTKRKSEKNDKINMKSEEAQDENMAD